MGMMSNESNFDEHGRYVLRSYDQSVPFSSFLPGIAGLYGIPMWVFYSNRGQAISSFGVESKDSPIMEFQPANKAYQLTASLGFRTFVRGADWRVEPFSPREQSGVQRDMFVGMNEVEIREVNSNLGLETSVLYFNLMDEPYAGLVRQVTFRNLGHAPLDFEVLDGMPAIMPYGVDNGLLKHIGRTIEAWMEVFNLDAKMPFYRLRASAADTSDVRAIEAGNFALAVANGNLLPAYVDPVVVFGADTAFSQPQGFLDGGLQGLADKPQIIEGRTPCAMFGCSISIGPGEEHTFASVYGYAQKMAALSGFAEKLLAPNYLDEKYTHAQAFAEVLTEPIATQSGDVRFDAYSRQTFLDNLLRGGWPQMLGGKHIYHTYSRKHGDPERDYNHFFLAAENYSQGNGNYRDVNQNRRCDVLFEPKTADFDIRLFMSLIQLDGYNPLVVEGTYFTLAKDVLPPLLAQAESPDALAELLSDSFTPGQLLAIAAKCGLRIAPHEFLERVMAQAEQHIQATFGEGYWVDHWTYNLDLIEAYLLIYPDERYNLLFDSEPLPFYDSLAVVNPRNQKYVLDGDMPRQFNAIKHDEEKAAILESRHHDSNWTRTKHGKGAIFKLPLISKLVLLAVLKFATRDPLGMGVEMEAGRPGWYDALNGLPGLFGSSMPESFELLRLLYFLSETLRVAERDIDLPVEGVELLKIIMAQLAENQDSFVYWDAISTAREEYRTRTRLGVDGVVVSISAQDLLQVFGEMTVAVQAGIKRAYTYGDGLPPTYFAFAVEEFEVLDATDQEGRFVIKPKRFNCMALPYFLEGPVHQMKVLPTKEERQQLFRRVQASPLFDKKLNMYKLNASLLEQPHSIGRARAFSPGWLENESIWMHMAYKYLLEALRSGLYEEFFSAIQNGMPPFMNEMVYGRSPLENSSFIASSAHPDEGLHGRGFVARLSGSTAEFLNIWFLMMAGPQPFRLNDGGLVLAFEPALPGWLFREDGTLSFVFLGQCQVIYINPGRQDTYARGTNIVKQRLYGINEQIIEVDGEIIPAPYAGQIRSGDITKIEITLDN